MGTDNFPTVEDWHESRRPPEESAGGPLKAETKPHQEQFWTPEQEAGIENIMPPGRPIGVTVLALSVTVLGASALLGGLYMILTYIPSAGSTGGADPFVMAFLLIQTAVGAAMTVTGIGLWRLKAWAWSAAIVVLLIGLMVIASPFFIFSIFGLVFLVYLLKVREYFE